MTKFVAKSHSQLYAKIDELIKENKVDVVSFDVFDTLVHRRCDPNLVVYSVEKWLNKKLLDLGLEIKVDVSEARHKSYQELVDIKVAQGLDPDITLDEWAVAWIRICLDDEDFDNARLSKELVAIEIEYEKNSIFPNSKMLEIVKSLKATPIKLIYTSDMYLGKKYIDQILSDCGYDKLFDASYVSGDISLLKRTGNLFEYVITNESVPAQRIVHVGDNELADGKMASKKGLFAIELRDSSMDQRFKKLGFDFKRLNLDNNWTGVTAANYSSFVPGEIKTAEEIYGNNVLGPVLSTFIHRIAERCIEEEISDLYFVAREGHVLKNIFDILAPTIYSGLPRIRTHYLAASRLTTFSASVPTFNLRALSGAKNNSGIHSIRTIFAPFELDDSCLETIAQKYGFNDLEAPLPPDFSEWPPFQQLTEDIFLKDKIFANYTASRTNFLEYLRQKNFFGRKNIGFVDLGWSGQIQENLFQVVRDEKSCPKIFGFYLGTRVNAHRRKNHQNWMEWILADDSHLGFFGNSIFDFVQGFEMLVRAPHGTTIGYKDEDNVITPQFKSDMSDSRMLEKSADPMIALVQEGALEFARNYKNILKMVGFGASQTLDYSRLIAARMIMMPRKNEVTSFAYVDNVADLGSNETYRFVKRETFQPFRLSTMRSNLRLSHWKYASAVSMFGRILAIPVITLIALRRLPKVTHSIGTGIVFNMPDLSSRCLNVETDNCATASYDKLYESLNDRHLELVEEGRKSALCKIVSSSELPVDLFEAISMYFSYHCVRISSKLLSRRRPHFDAINIKSLIKKLF